MEIILPGAIRASEGNGKSRSFQLTKNVWELFCSRYCKINPLNRKIDTITELKNDISFVKLNRLTLNITSMAENIASTIVEIMCVCTSNEITTANNIGLF